MCRSKSPPRVVNTKAPANGRRPDDLVLDQPLDMFQHWVSLIAGLGERGINIGIKQDRIRTIDALRAASGSSLAQLHPDRRAHQRAG